MMLNYFAALVRLSVIAAFLFFMAALAASQLHPVDGRGGSRSASSWDSLSDGIDPEDEQVQLIDRKDGRTRTMAAPKGERWQYLSPAPWRDHEGVVEAVGRFTRSPARGASATAPACGLVRLRLPQAEVIERVAMDVIPTARPAWNPLDDGQVVLAAGDGRLYSYRFDARDVAEGLIATPEKEAAVGADLVPVRWSCRPPGGAEPFLSDPVWPNVPELHNLLIVSLSALAPGENGRAQFAPAVLWWLELDADGEQVVDAGPLIDPSDVANEDAGVRHRQPSIEVRDGRIELAYHASRLGNPEGETRVGELERRPEDGRPRLRVRSTGRGSARRALLDVSDPWRVDRRARGFACDLGRIADLRFAADGAFREDRATEFFRFP